MKIAIVYGSSTGNTETIADNLQELLEAESELINVADIGPEDLKKYDIALLGIPTWNTGELQEDWIAFHSQMDGVDLSKLKIAIFGLGDAQGYAHNFQDGVGILYEKFIECGAQGGFGFWPTDDYSYKESLAVRDDHPNQFCGLALDEDNESDLTADRLSEWVTQVKAELAIA